HTPPLSLPDALPIYQRLNQPGRRMTWPPVSPKSIPAARFRPTYLTPSPTDLLKFGNNDRAPGKVEAAEIGPSGISPLFGATIPRSEEHTSELQSPYE